MEAFKKDLQDRRVTVLSGLKNKMEALRTENQFLKELLQLHNIECPPLEEITATEPETESQVADVIVKEDQGPQDAEPKSCDRCERSEGEVLRLKKELSQTQGDLQDANGQILSQTTELQKVQNHCQALKDVNRIIKELIGIRDQELSQLKEKLKEIELTMSERETEIMSENLRTEYTRQLDNIKRLKTLYEQRARSADAEIEILKRKLADKNTEIDNELLKSQGKEERIAALEEEIVQLKADLSSTRDSLKDSKNEMELLQNDLRAINMLFTRILMNKDNFDLDRLKNVLEENRMLLTEVTTRSNDCSIIADSVLPKLLCDLIVEAFADPEITENEPTEEIKSPELLSTDAMIENLPKIWRILTELLIHQKTSQITLSAIGQSEDCYKTVDTPTGPQLVLSVSKTFIKLKDLILEKKGLQKETKRLKVLNQHLQQTLHNQEDRLGAVSVEVTKTWHLVNRMQRQHRQLHTREQVLRYHLQQKRRMLNELKEELETCRHKWTKAREKNEDSEAQWRTLRDEFTSRKEKSNSVESGYSDDQITDEDVEDVGQCGASELPPSIAIDPLDETLEQMFYRLNAIHTVNSINFEPNPNEPRETSTISISSTETAREQAFQDTRSTETYNELPPHLIDENGDIHVDVSDEDPIIGVEIGEITAPAGPSVAATEPEEPSPGGSGLTAVEEQYTARRNERIKRLEEQCRALFDKMTSNKKKGDELSEQLDTIHTRQRTTAPEDNPQIASTSQEPDIDGVAQSSVTAETDQTIQDESTSSQNNLTQEADDSTNNN